MSLSALLLLVVAFTHYGIDPLCDMIPQLAHASRAIFYVMRGLEGAVLFAVICKLRPALWPVCLWGFFEESETAVCRMSAGLSSSPSAEAWSGLCGLQTGLPLYMLGIVVLAILATGRNHEPGS